MMRDWAGLDDASEESSEGESAGPGDKGSAVCPGADASFIGVDGCSIAKGVSGCLFDCTRTTGGMVPALCLRCPGAVAVDGEWTICGRFADEKLKLLPGPALGVSGTLPSFLVEGPSLRMDKDEGALP